METIGKLMFLIVLIGGLGLGVNEITDSYHEAPEVAYASVDESMFDPEAYEPMSEALKNADVPAAVKPVRLVSTPPKTLWSKSSRNGIAVDQNIENMTASEVSASSTSGELRVLKNYWHQKYHLMLKSDKSASNHETKLAFQKYLVYKKALTMK